MRLVVWVLGTFFLQWASGVLWGFSRTTGGPPAEAPTTGSDDTLSYEVTDGAWAGSAARLIFLT